MRSFVLFTVLLDSVLCSFMQTSIKNEKLLPDVNFAGRKGCFLNNEASTSDLSCSQPFEDQTMPYLALGATDGASITYKATDKADLYVKNGTNIFKTYDAVSSCTVDLIRLRNMTFGSCAKHTDTLNIELASILKYIKDSDLLQCTLNADLWDMLHMCSDVNKPRVTSDPVLLLQSLYKAGLETEMSLALSRADYRSFTSKYSDEQTLDALFDVYSPIWSYRNVELEITLVIDPTFVRKISQTLNCNRKHQQTTVVIGMQERAVGLVAAICFLALFGTTVTVFIFCL